MEDPNAGPFAAGFPQQQIQQDTACSMPSSVSKFDNTKRRKPWEVFKKQPQDEQVESSVQYDSFRDKCPQSSMQGSGFPSMLNQKKGYLMSGPSSQLHLDQNSSKNSSLNLQSKRIYKGSGLSDYTSRSSGGISSHQSSYQSKRSFQPNSKGGYMRSSTSKSSIGMEETNENTNSANLRYESKDSNGTGKFRYNNSTMKGQQMYSKRMSSNDSDNGKQDSLSRSASLESGEADSNRHRNNRRQKSSGSWSRVSEKQRLDRPPSYKDYLGALTSQAGKGDVCEPHFTGGDLEDGEIKQQQEEESQRKLQGSTLGNLNSASSSLSIPPLPSGTQQNKTYAPSTPVIPSLSNQNNGGSASKVNGAINTNSNSINHMSNNNPHHLRKPHPQKQAGQQRRPELEEENAKKRIKPNDQAENNFPPIPHILNELDEPFHLLKRMDQLGNEVYKNKQGNNYQMQQTLAAQQDAFLHQYFNKQRQPHSKLLEASGIHGSGSNRKDRKFDIKNYQVDLQKNMIDKKVTITEGLLNLAKIQSEMYSASNAKKRAMEVTSATTPNGKYSRTVYPDKELSESVGKDPSSNNVEHTSNRRNEKFQAALNQFEEKHMQMMNQKKPSKKSSDRRSSRVEEDKKIEEIFNGEIDHEDAERMEDEEDEFEKFNEQYLKQHEKMLEDIANRNKENLKKTISNASTTKAVEPVIPTHPLDDQLNPLELLIKEELERNRQDKQAHSHRLIELAKLQESQHVKHLEMIAKKKPEGSQKQPHVNRFSAIPAPNQSSSSSCSLNSLPAPNSNDSSFSNNQQQQSKRQTKFQEKPSSQNDQTDRLRHIPSSQQQHLSSSSRHQGQPSMSSRNYGFPVPPPPPPPPAGPSITSLAQLQQQLFSNNSKQHAPNTPQQPQQQQQVILQQQPLPHPQQLQQIPLPPQHQPPAPLLPHKPPSQHSLQNQVQPLPPQPQDQVPPPISFQQNPSNSRRKESQEKPYPQEEILIKGVEKQIQPMVQQQVQAPSVLSKEDFNPFGAVVVTNLLSQEIEIPDSIKNKQKHIRPALYDKVVSDYIRLQKQQIKEDNSQSQQQEKIQDPRRRARQNQAPIQAITAPSQTQEVLPIPSLKEDEIEIESEIQPQLQNKRVLSFSVETNPSSDDYIGQRSEHQSIQNNTVYNYKLLKSDKTMTTQERNLYEKNQTHEQNLANQQQNGTGGIPAIEQQDNNFGDLFKNDKEIRYFKDNLSMHCFKCGQNGHFAKWCTAEGIDDKTKCLFCLGDHNKESCPNYVCFKCCSVGHRIKDCAQEYQSDSIRCRLCRQKGHSIKNCGGLNVENNSKNFDYPSLQDTVCLSCDGIGHINCFDSGTYATYDGLYQIEEKHASHEIL